METKGGAKRTEKVKITNERTKGRRRRTPLLFQILFIKHVLFPAFGMIYVTKLCYILVDFLPRNPYPKLFP